MRTAGGVDLSQLMAAGTFAEETVISLDSVIAIRSGMPLQAAAILGCAGITGFGAAMNTAQIQAGDTVVVLGCGPVGLFAIQGARIAGARQIIAIDRVTARLELAATVGATDMVDAQEDPVDTVRMLTPGRSVDVVIEAVGSQQTVGQAIRMTGRGGRTIFVGAGGHEVQLGVPVYEGMIAPAKSLVGCFLGSADIRVDVPNLVDLYLAGEVIIDPLISTRTRIDDVADELASVGRADRVASIVEF